MLHIADVFGSMFPEQRFRVHTNREREFDHLGSGEVIVEVITPSANGENLYLFNHKSTLTLVYADWSCHYPRDDEGAEHMMQVVQSILTGESHVEKLEWNNDCLITLIYKNRLLFSGSANHDWHSFLNNAPFLEAIAHGKALITKYYWNPA